jgi:hypothetical protein
VNIPITSNPKKVIIIITMIHEMIPQNMLLGYTLVIIQQITNKIMKHRINTKKKVAIVTPMLIGFGTNNVMIIEKILEKIKIAHLILLF